MFHYANLNLHPPEFNYPECPLLPGQFFAYASTASAVYVNYTCYCWKNGLSPACCWEVFVLDVFDIKEKSHLIKNQYKSFTILRMILL